MVDGALQISEVKILVMQSKPKKVESSGFEDVEPMAEPKKIFAMLEKAQKVRLLAAWDEQHTAELDMDQLG